MGRSLLIKSIQNKRLIFTVTTGRSGTAYLASVFSLASGVTSLHEPAPEYSEVHRKVQRNQSIAKQFLLKQKLPAIAGDSSQIYIETSHLACKGFLEPLLHLNIVPDLIIHRRPTRDVARSMFKMGTIPGRSDKGLKFYLSPVDPGVLSLSAWQSLHDYQLCYWYCLEIEKRARFYKVLFQQHGARIAETTLQGLKTYAGLTKCFLDLDLKPKFPAWLTRLRFLRSTGVKVNESRETKKDVPLPLNLNELEQEVIQRIDKQELQKWLPEMIVRSGE